VQDRRHNLTKKSNVPLLVIASVSDKNVREMIKLAIQLTQVVVDVPVLRAHSGYISELMVHGIGPIPAVHQLIIYNAQQLHTMFNTIVNNNKKACYHQRNVRQFLQSA